MPDTPKLPETCDTQAQFFALWGKHLGGDAEKTLAPTQVAEQGARLADRAAWVFVAGYQGALRQCFPALRTRGGWASYLVSEARDDTKTPTCTVEVNADHVLLEGSKNWVAASPNLEWLVVNATLSSGVIGAETVNCLLNSSTPGAERIAKPSGRFLPELEVGKAVFSSARLDTDAVIADDDCHVHLFGLIEARCLLVAMAAHFAQLAPAAPKPAESLLLSAGLVTAELSSRACIEVLLSAMDLLVEWFEEWHAADSDGETEIATTIRHRWSEDQRLLQMHRPLLEKTLEKTLEK